MNEINGLSEDDLIHELAVARGIIERLRNGGVSEQEVAAVTLLREQMERKPALGNGYWNWLHTVEKFLADYDASGRIITHTPECTGEVEP